MSYRVELAAVAERHVHAIAAWWTQNGPNAPSMFERELSAGLDRIAEVPRSGQPFALAGAWRLAACCWRKRATILSPIAEIDGGRIAVF